MDISPVFDLRVHYEGDDKLSIIRQLQFITAGKIAVTSGVGLFSVYGIPVK